MTITEAVGYSIGVLGMSLDDFCLLRHDEWAEAVARQREQSHEAWERMRLLSCVLLRPHTDRMLDPKEVLRFPWDDEHKVDEARHEAPVMTKAERRKRMAELAAAAGVRYTPKQDNNG